jgi:hypothetical protein
MFCHPALAGRQPEAISAVILGKSKSRTFHLRLVLACYRSIRTRLEWGVEMSTQAQGLTAFIGIVCILLGLMVPRLWMAALGGAIGGGCIPAIRRIASGMLATCPEHGDERFQHRLLVIGGLPTPPHYQSTAPSQSTPPRANGRADLRGRDSALPYELGYAL